MTGTSVSHMHHLNRDLRFFAALTNGYETAPMMAGMSVLVDLKNKVVSCMEDSADEYDLVGI